MDFVTQDSGCDGGVEGIDVSYLWNCTSLIAECQKFVLNAFAFIPNDDGDRFL